MFDDLLAALDQLVGQMGEATLDEIDDVCDNVIFQALMDHCARRLARVHTHGEEESE